MTAAKVIVVGSGVLGLMHAKLAVDAGHEVMHLEQEADARGASVRNFGLVWVSGRAPGNELQLALRARELWEQIATDVPRLGFRPAGSLTLVTSPAERAVLEDVCARTDAPERGFRLLDVDEVRRVNPAVRGEVLAGLYAEHDAIVEPRRVPAAVRDALTASGRYTFVPSTEVVDVDSGAAGVTVTAASGRRWSGDQVLMCTGAWHQGLAARWLAAEAERLVRRVRLHMMQTAPFEMQLTTAIADADSLRYYPAYSEVAAQTLPPQDAAADAWGMQLLMAQRLDGSLTIGDTHLYDEPFDFDLEEVPYTLLAERAERLLGGRIPPVVRRWDGVYSQLAPQADTDLTETAAEGLYLHREVLPQTHLVTGPGGRGMTLAPLIAERTLTVAGLV